MADGNTTLNDSSRPHIDYSEQTADKVTNFFTLYVEAFALFGGLVGNVLVFVIFGRTSYYTKSIHVYIRSLAAFDFVVLVGPMMTHWMNVNFFPERKHATVCALFLTVSRFCVDCTAWVITAMAANQYVAVLFPHRFKTLFSLRHIRLIVTVIVAVSILKNVYCFQSAGFVEHHDGTKLCVLVPDSGNRAMVAYQLADVALSCVVPFLCMTYFNVCVVLRLDSKKKTKYATKMRQLSKILLVVSVLFVVSALCTKISATVLTYCFGEPDANRSYFVLANAVARAVWCAINAASMWVYLAMCPHFRYDIKRIVCPLRKTAKIEPPTSGRRIFSVSQFRLLPPSITK